MIRIIDQASRLRYRDTLDQFFRFRHDIFVKECGWTDFDLDGEREQDRYDDEHAVYGVALTGDDRIAGCMRFYPSTQPHMLNDTFAYLVDGPVPEQDDIVELSRLAVAREKRDGYTYCELFAGLQEYCLEEGYVGVTAVIRAYRLPVVQGAGLTVHPLGLPRDVNGEKLVAVMYEVNEPTLHRLRAAGRLAGPVLERSMPVEDAVRRIA